MCLPFAQAKDNACQEAGDNSDHHGKTTIEKAMMPSHGSDEWHQVIPFEGNDAGSEQGAGTIQKTVEFDAIFTNRRFGWQQELGHDLLAAARHRGMADTALNGGKHPFTLFELDQTGT